MPAEARSEFRDRFLETVREIQDEAAVVPPARFSKSATWSAWLRRLYALSIAADKKLRLADRAADTPDESAQALEKATGALKSIRAHFYRLRLETDTRKANDYLYAFAKEANREKPDAAALAALMREVERAAPPLRLEDKPKAFEKQRDGWIEQASPLLKDDRLSISEIELLRAATRPFHRAFGMRIE